VLAQRRNQRLKTAIFGGQRQIHTDPRALSGRQVALGSHSRAIYDQRSGIGVEQMDPNEETVRGTPRFARLVTDFKLRRSLPVAGPGLPRIQICRRLHVYSHPGSVPAPRRLAAHRVNAIAAQRRVQPVAFQQMHHPAELGMRQVAKLASLQPVHLKPGVYQQLVNLARRVFAIVRASPSPVSLGRR